MNWQQGEDVIIAGSVSDEEAKQIYPDGWQAPRPLCSLRWIPSTRSWAACGPGSGAALFNADLLAFQTDAANPLQHARDRLRQLTTRDRLLLDVEQVTRELNLFLRGWAGYFRYGNSARQFDQITRHAFDRLAIFVAKRHQRPARWGRWKLRSPERAGLLCLNGTVLAPRPNRPWRSLPNATR